MPLLHEIVRAKLCSIYYGDFSVIAEASNKLNITIAGSEKSYFSTNVINRDNTRLIISITPERFAADFVRAVANASIEQKNTFCNIWSSIGTKYLTVTINGQNITPAQFPSLENNWTQFEIRFSKAPFYDPESDDRDEKIVDYIAKCMSLIFSLVSIQIIGFSEGKAIERTTTTHERNPINRQICLTAKGYACEACGVVLEDIYGPVAKKFIEVHHSIMVSSMGEDYVVKPLEDLHPLCPNCHAIAHRKNPPFTVDEIKAMLARNNDSSFLSRNSLAAEPPINYYDSNS